MYWIVLKGKDRLQQLANLKYDERSDRYYDYTVTADEYSRTVTCKDPLHCAELLAADPTLSFNDDLFYLRVMRKSRMKGWEAEDEESTRDES